MPHVLADEYKQGCPIWGTPAHIFDYDGHFKKVISPRVTVPYLVFSPELGSNGEFDYLQENEDKAKLTTMIIERYGEEELHCVGDEYVRQAKKRQILNTSKRMNRLLKCLVKKSEESLIGSKLHINPDDKQHELVVYNDRTINTDEYAKSVKTCYEAWALSESTTLQELHFMINQLENAGLLEVAQRYAHGIGLACTVTHAGYQEIEEYTVNSNSLQAFVAMWFGKNNQGEDEEKDTMIKLYRDGIKKAIENTGYEPMQIGEKEDVDKIDDEIIAEIRRSRFLIADYTHGKDGARGGVYYEAGFAQGLGIPVIRSCRSGQLPSLHFDTRQYHHIEWTTPEDLCTQLEKRIRAMIR